MNTKIEKRLGMACLALVIFATIPNWAFAVPVIVQNNTGVTATDFHVSTPRGPFNFDFADIAPGGTLTIPNAALGKAGFVAGDEQDLIDQAYWTNRDGKIDKPVVLTDGGSGLSWDSSAPSLVYFYLNIVPPGGGAPIPALPGSFRIADGVVTPIPIPGALWLFGSALAGIYTISRRKQTKRLGFSA